MFKNRNLPKDATPWGREVETRVQDLEDAIKVLKSTATSNSSQLQTIGNNTSSLWNAINSNYLRFGKNAIINSAMDIWQRGTSSAAGGYCCADRWYVYAGAGTTASQETVIVPDGFKYALKLVPSAQTSVGIRQIIENQNAAYFSGKTVTVSMYVAASIAPEDFNIILKSSILSDPLSTDASWTELNVSKVDGTVTTSNTYSRISATFNVPSNSKTLWLAVESSVAAGASIYITGVQMESGSYATDFYRATPTIQMELSACQRYFWTNATRYQTWAYAAAAGNFAETRIPFPTTMRIAPVVSSTFEAPTNTSGGVVSATTTQEIIIRAPATAAGQAYTWFSAGNTFNAEIL